MKQYEAFPVRPLKMRGVFGVTWKLYTRGFWGMLLFTLVFAGLVSLAQALLQNVTLGATAELLEEYQGFSSSSPYAILEILAPIFSSSQIMSLLNLLSLLLLTPILIGVAYTEYGRRMQGKVSKTGTLFRNVGFGLKHFYGTYWSNILIEIAIGFVLGIIILLLLILSIAVGASFLRAPSDGGGLVAMLVIALVMAVVLFVVAFGAIQMLAFTFPIAANEGLKNFRAVKRSFQLVWKRFFRVFWARLIPTLILGLGLSLVLAAFVLLTRDILPLSTTTIISSLFAVVVALLFEPYLMALNTVLYFDTVARMPAEAPQAIVPPQGGYVPQPPYGSPYPPQPGAQYQPPNAFQPVPPQYAGPSQPAAPSYGQPMPPQTIGYVVQEPQMVPESKVEQVPPVAPEPDPQEAEEAGTEES